MNLIGSNSYDNTKSKRTQTIILVAIVLVFIAIIAIICTILYVQKNVFRVYINGVSYNLPEGIIIKNESGKVYVDIKGIASYLGYDAHDGEYKVDTEDENKCYVECENETASFFLNSNKISKVPPGNEYDYEDYTIADPVINKDGKLYCTIEGIKVGFNVVFEYNETEKNVQIYTLPDLVKRYTNTFKGYGYDELSDNFNNQKAILYNLFVVKKANSQYAVVNSKNEEIIGARYRDIEFNESAKEFYVKNSLNKVGVLTSTGKNKINLIYDKITMIDKNLGLYLVNNQGKFGVVGNTGNIVIHLEYDQIGVDTSKFENNDIKNRYILFENAIPVCQNKKYGLFDVKGNMIVPLEWDYLGYSSGAKGVLSGKIVSNALIIPNYKAIVLGKNIDKEAKYAIYDSEGNKIVPCRLDNVYFITSSGVNTYYMYFEGQEIDVEKYIEALYEQQGKNKPLESVGNNSNTDN